MSKMMEIATRYANGEEEDRIRSGKHKKVGDADGGNTRKQKQKAPPTPQAEATAVTNAKFKGKGKAQFTPKKKSFNNPILDQPCSGFSEGQPSEKDHEQDEVDKEDPFPQVHATLMIFADVESKSRLKLVNREVNMATPSSPKFLKWSQTAITFDQSDHPTHVHTPGRQALVVDPVVEGVRLRKVLMDGGSGLNIMYADTLKGMGIPMSKLKSKDAFHGVAPDGRPSHSPDRVRRRWLRQELPKGEADVKWLTSERLSRTGAQQMRTSWRPMLRIPLKMPVQGVITITSIRPVKSVCRGSRIADQMAASSRTSTRKRSTRQLMRSKKPA
ncbi:hypothetical protein ZWY2020_014890 [Hordeum vulgare]|nr:hypothetical protein ZWY2020_014890 [Hordeum vulgare]